MMRNSVEIRNHEKEPNENLVTEEDNNQIKNTGESLHNRLYQAEERISELEDSQVF
jgi:hypothetical protein